MNEIAIDVEDVTKVYGAGSSAVTALQKISLQIRDNEFFTLLGPSGCGKTTLLRMIAGFEDITGGTIRLFGEEIDRLPPNRRPVNTVFQHYALFPHLTVYENVAFGLKRLGHPADFIADRTNEMLALTQMTSFADRKPGQLSGGQQQRVALARALAPQPKVLLLDEPLSALDLKLRQAMREELKQLQQSTGITFIFVTHDQEEALTMSNRIVVMSEGEIQQIGTPRDIYENPRNRFVANFVGEANILDAQIVKKTKTSCQLDLAAGNMIVVPAAKVANALTSDVGDFVSVVIRPEHVTVSKTSDGKPKVGQIQGAVAGITYLGTDTHYTIALDADTRIVARMQNSQRKTVAMAVGDKVQIAVEEGAISVLGA